MDYLSISGPSRLSGTVTISGAKNAALPLIAATLLCNEPCTIDNIPDVADIRTLLKLLGKLGSEFVFEEHTLSIDNEEITNTTATYDIVKTMRASILVLGPLLARFGRCEVSLPGGCAIGQRPIDLHLKALEQMGALIEIKNGYVVATAPEGLRGARIIFDKVTVTGSENIIMAAALAKGKTELINVAKEPEVVQLCEVLRDAGLQIEGIGTDELTIHGTDREPLCFQPFSIIPDRIEAGTYLCAAAITYSSIRLENVRADHLDAVTAKLHEAGCRIENDTKTMTIYPAARLKAFEISTTEYPGFPTDMQAQFMALATQAEGVSIIEERLFENRFMHVSELQRLGASIHLKGNTATLNGPIQLLGADVMATDLRASSALVLGGLAASGVTNVHRIYHLDRGYERLHEKLKGLGVDLERLKE
ncbi:UDP-N-acetylglucosamine 1-carboxyvinyltransferase [Hydrogenimonas cancrithermarum]|uniref:UDP-N-acetylglucosamine 1-carboxyvinyltransferase n=1 Tax=Hydrogenimonas cancrithermarum TaxID=2993563 RepID=A0ABN6WTP8_9BACT|nr:UDP-N-acetylglucosamine 1-carboxyvinyltransferase [Hydrogenimonas cancrithermarum]BDY12045.1 UDP-N-acetylglucosamine 1-carboxyvinyltransferase [Hydrogenimonas cancrithermarum]